MTKKQQPESGSQRHASQATNYVQDTCHQGPLEIIKRAYQHVKIRHHRPVVDIVEGTNSRVGEPLQIHYPQQARDAVVAKEDPRDHVARQL